MTFLRTFAGSEMQTITCWFELRLPIPFLTVNTVSLSTPLCVCIMFWISSLVFLEIWKCLKNITSKLTKNLILKTDCCSVVLLVKYVLFSSFVSSLSEHSDILSLTSLSSITRTFLTIKKTLKKHQILSCHPLYFWRRV